MMSDFDPKRASWHVDHCGEFGDSDHERRLIMQSTTSESRMTARTYLAAASGGGALASTLLLWPLLGNVAAYVSLVMSLLAAPLGWSNADWHRIRSSSMLWTFGLAFILLTAAFVSQPGWPSVAAIGDFSMFAAAPIIAMAMAALSRVRFTLQHLVVLCIAGAAISAVIGIHGIANGDTRVTAPNFSPIHFAAFAITLGFMGLGLTLTGQMWWRWVTILAPLLGIVGAVASGTRSALLAAAMLSLLYGVFWMQQRRLPLWFKLIAPILLVGGAVLLFYLASLMGFPRPFEALRAAWGAITGNLGDDSSTAYRLEMYHGGWMAFLASPLVGHGWSNQLAAALPYMSDMARAGFEAEHWGYIHNDALSLAVAAGIPGFIAYCLFMVTPWLSVRDNPAEKGWSLRSYLALSFTLGIFVSGMTDVFFMVELPKVALIVVTSALLFFKDDTRQNDR